MTQSPLVSVLMTAYNRENFIAEAIESVLASTYPNFELIIVDDQSTDRTVEIVRSFEKKDSRIKLNINEKNLGDYPNRNRAASYASGDYLMYVDSDDMLFPESMARLVNMLEPLPHVNMGMYWRHSPDTFVLESTPALQKHFFEQQFLFMGPGGTILRRSFFNKIKGYPEKYGPANDMYFNLKAACYSSILLIPFEFVYYRRHDGQEVNNRFSYMYNNYRYMRDALAELPLPFTPTKIAWLRKKNKRRFTVHLIKFFINTRNFRKTREAYLKADFSLLYMLQGIFQ